MSNKTKQAIQLIPIRNTITMKIDSTSLLVLANRSRYTWSNSTIFSSLTTERWHTVCLCLLAIGIGLFLCLPIAGFWGSQSVSSSRWFGTIGWRMHLNPCFWWGLFNRGRSTTPTRWFARLICWRTSLSYLFRSGGWSGRVRPCSITVFNIFFLCAIFYWHYRFRFLGIFVSIILRFIVLLVWFIFRFLQFNTISILVRNFSLSFYIHWYILGAAAATTHHYQTNN